MSSISNQGASIYEQVGLTRSRQVESNTEMGQSDFLKLMTTQLQNQDPFSPMENTEFLSQMAQFGTVSGVDRLNGSFDSLATALNGNRALQASMIVGSQVLVSSATHRLEADAGLSGAVDLPQPVADLSVRLEDQFGQVMGRIELGPQPAGLVEFDWNGVNASGVRAPAGTYRMVAEGNLGERTETFETLAMANVDSVSLGRGPGEFTLALAGLGEVSLDQVRQIKQ